MQFAAAIVAVITMLGATASPAPWGGNPPTNCPPDCTPPTISPPPTSSSGSSGSITSSGDSGSCKSASTEYCCDSSDLLGLTCILSSVLGNGCSEQTICCINNGGVQECSQTDGTTINVPINLAIAL